MHPGAGADVPSATSAPRPSSAALDVAGDDRPRIRHVAVVALADDRDHDVVRVRARRRGPRPGSTVADGVRAAQIDGVSIAPALVDLELRGQLADAVDGRRAAGAGNDGGATTVTPVRSPLAACAWPTRTPGTSVIALRWPARPADGRPRHRDRASAPRSASRPLLAAATALDRGAGRRRAGPARRRRSAPDRPGRRARSGAGSAGGSDTRSGPRSASGSSPVEQLAPSAPARRGTGIAVTSAWV